MNELTESLNWLVSAGGAGIAAWWLFRQLRATFPAPVEPPASPVVRLGYRFLYVDALAYLVVGILAGGVSLAASYALSVTTGAAFDPQAATALVVATAIHQLQKLASPS